MQRSPSIDKRLYWLDQLKSSGPNRITPFDSKILAFHIIIEGHHISDERDFFVAIFIWKKNFRFGKIANNVSTTIDFDFKLFHNNHFDVKSYDAGTNEAFVCVQRR